MARPLVEIRHYFDLTKHLLRVKDELQSMRVLAVLCGLQGPAWRLRPNLQSGRMENETIFGDITNDPSEDSVENSSRYPLPPDFAHPGLLCRFRIHLPLIKYLFIIVSCLQLLQKIISTR